MTKPLPCYLKPIGDRRLEEIRIECRIFDHILSSDVSRLLARLDGREAELVEREAALVDLRARAERHEHDARYLRTRLDARERELAALELEHQTLLRRLDALQRAGGAA